jgi:hypothetical protein
MEVRIPDCPLNLNAIWMPVRPECGRQRMLAKEIPLISTLADEGSKGDRSTVYA